MLSGIIEDVLLMLEWLRLELKVFKAHK
jgi:hypothetical protein